MYRSGNIFSYEIPPFKGSYRSQLSLIEENSKRLISENVAHKNKLFELKNECNDVKVAMQMGYNKLHKELIDEVDKVEDEYKKRFNKQKVFNIKIRSELEKSKKDNNDLRYMIESVKQSIEELRNKIAY